VRQVYEGRQDPESGGLSPDGAAHCATVISYIEDMTAWLDADAASGSRLEFARQVLAEIDRKGKLGRQELEWCEARLESLYGESAGEG
jgi:hypothetical protein